jgi:hypothetical protein
LAITQECCVTPKSRSHHRRLRRSRHRGAAAAGLGLVDGDVAVVELLSVHLLDGVAHGLLVGEGDETEAAGPPGLTIVDDLHALHSKEQVRSTSPRRDLAEKKIIRNATVYLGLEDLAEGAEGGMEGVVTGGPGKAADEAAVLNARRLFFHTHPRTQ